MLRDRRHIRNIDVSIVGWCCSLLRKKLMWTVEVAVCEISLEVPARLTRYPRGR